MKSKSIPVQATDSSPKSGVTQVSGACNFCRNILNLNHRGHRRPLSQPSIELTYKPPLSPVFFPPCSSVLPVVKILAAPDSPTELFPLSMRIMFRWSCPHDRLSALVFSLRAVLARGPAGSDLLSDRVAAVAALSADRHRRL